MSIFGLEAIARAIIRRCFCPPDIPPEPSEIMGNNPMVGATVACAVAVEEALKG